LTAFLEKLSDVVVNDFADIHEVTVVLPSRRAGLYFRKFLSSRLKHPRFAPRIYSIDDYISSLSPYSKADRIELLADLYGIYIKYFPSDAQEDFERFYPWGEMIISDFDEIDKNLADAAKVFRAVRAEKEIQEEFEIDVESEYFRMFWKNFSNLKPHAIRNDFLKIWEVLGKIYTEFRDILLEKKRVYDGISYRKVYELITSHEIVPQGSIIFAGFNLLTKSEECIIRELLRQNKARIYWDADEYYLHNENHEAGTFIRKHIKNLNISEPQWIENQLAKQAKNIKVISAPLTAGMVKAAGDIIGQIPPDLADDTAVVLPDESLLLPLLCSLPDSVSEINITMGFPPKHSRLFSLLESVKTLHKNKSNKGFYFSNITELFSHPYISKSGHSEIRKIIYEINTRNIIYINQEMILREYMNLPPLAKDILSDPDTTGVYNYICRIINDLDECFRTDNYNEHDIYEHEILRMISLKLNVLNETMIRCGLKPGFDLYMQLLLEELSRERIPFEGDYLKGLQVMGLLETRTLNFRNVVILSMNEGSLPRNTRRPSFIPYNLRKAFGLSTYDEEDAISAYLFFRLLQGAEYITLIYRTAEEGLSPAEKSRYIMQIESELVKSNPDINYSVSDYSPEAVLLPENKITVQKTTDVINQLLSVKNFSPSALSLYINCPLQFYLKYVVGLEKPETAEEVLSGAAFGNIFHQIMENLYMDCKGNELDKSAIEKIINDFNLRFEDYWKSACRRYDDLEIFTEQLSGRNLLLKSVMKKLILKVLENDIKNTPFRITELEKKLEYEYRLSNEHKIILKGRLDRIEQKDGIVRIIDYKTVRRKFGDNMRVSEVENLFKLPDSKELFQLYFYLFIYNKYYPVARVKIGLYNIVDFNSNIKFIDDDSLTEEKLEEFGRHLDALISEIFNPDIPFSQTSDEKRCYFCDFRSLCYRD